MYIKNIGTKIISFGNVMILPDKIERINERYANTPTFDILKSLGFIVEVSEPRKETAVDDATDGEKSKNESDGNDDIPAAEVPVVETTVSKAKRSYKKATAE